MKTKNVWTNYKIYAFILGIIIGTVVYNLLGMDFSFVRISKIEGNKFLDSLVYFSMNNLKFWIIIFFLSFLKIKEKVLFCVIFIESFLLAGFITITILTRSTILFYETIMVIFKIVCALFMYNENKRVLYKGISLLFLIVGTIVENIFFIYF